MNNYISDERILRTTPLARILPSRISRIIWLICRGVKRSLPRRRASSPITLRTLGTEMSALIGALLFINQYESSTNQIQVLQELWRE